MQLCVSQYIITSRTTGVHKLKILEYYINMHVHLDHDLTCVGILEKLLKERESQEESSTLTADVHFLCWGYDDGLVQTEKAGSGVLCLTMLSVRGFSPGVGTAL